MLYLTSTSDLIQVVTTTTANVNVHASWADVTGSPPAVTVGRTNTAISSAATTTVVASPATSTSRTVKEMKISNDHASASNVVSVQHVSGGGSTITLESVTLGPGERMGYIEGVGIRVFDSSGREKTQTAPAAMEQNLVTADQTLTSADTYIAGSAFDITNRLKIGSIVRWTITAAKTDSAGSTAPTFNIRVGTAGAIGDTARCIMTGKAQTAVPDVARIEIAGHFRVVGALAVIQAVMGGDHGLATTGMSVGGFANQIASSAFDVTPANTKLGVSINPATSSVWVVKTCAVEGLFLAA